MGLASNILGDYSYKNHSASQTIITYIASAVKTICHNLIFPPCITAEMNTPKIQNFRFLDRKARNKEGSSSERKRDARLEGVTPETSRKEDRVRRCLVRNCNREVSGRNFFFFF
jgi:hypothetical protein